MHNTDGRYGVVVVVGGVLLGLSSLYSAHTLAWLSRNVENGKSYRFPLDDQTHCDGKQQEKQYLSYGEGS